MTGFARTFQRENAPLHAAAHSHHPWPDATYDAQIAAWEDAARLLDRKWDYAFETAIPSVQAHIARQLALPDPASIAFAPNTHQFVLRLLSCFPLGRPVRILTTGSEFMSFSRQIARLEEEGIVQVTRIGTQPFADFEQRFAQAAASGIFDLIFFSQVFYDSGFAVRRLARIVSSVSNPDTFIAIDGYHGFMALPTDLSAIGDRAFYLAGGYKYAMAGEGACFIHCPPNYAPRPRDTGWFAGFDALGSGASHVAYAPGGARFSGATFDLSGLYRFNAVQDWLLREGWSVQKMLDHVRGLERIFLQALDSAAHEVSSALLVTPDDEVRGRFLAFHSAKAGEIAARLASQNIIVDHRGDRLRIGFGIYNTEADALRLAEALKL